MQSIELMVDDLAIGELNDVAAGDSAGTASTLISAPACIDCTGA